uniref:Uncharacterized protein n=1 Tax=Anguilla anguilla TaxID=7936 RepID=A0A0E9TPP8_ANGAN
MNEGLSMDSFYHLQTAVWETNGQTFWPSASSGDDSPVPSPSVIASWI